MHVWISFGSLVISSYVKWYNLHPVQAFGCTRSSPHYYYCLGPDTHKNIFPISRNGAHIYPKYQVNLPTFASAKNRQGNRKFRISAHQFQDERAVAGIQSKYG